eukprot:jgi/Chlat1/344/Chrsp10S08624
MLGLLAAAGVAVRGIENYAERGQVEDTAQKDKDKVTFDCGVEAGFQCEYVSRRSDNHPVRAILPFWGVLLNIFHIDYLGAELLLCRVKWFKKQSENQQPSVTDTGRFWVHRNQFFKEKEEPYIEADRLTGQVFFAMPTVADCDRLIVLEKEVATRVASLKSVRPRMEDPPPPADAEERRSSMSACARDELLRQAREAFKVGDAAAVGEGEEEMEEDSDTGDELDDDSN